MAKGKKGDGSAAPAAPLSAEAKARTAWLIAGGMGMHFLGSMLGMQAEQEIWNRHYKGDFGANAKTQAMLQSVRVSVELLVVSVSAMRHFAAACRHDALTVCMQSARYAI